MVDIDIGDSFWFVPISGGKPRKGTTMSLSDKDRLGPSAQVQCLESGAFFVVPIVNSARRDRCATWTLQECSNLAAAHRIENLMV